MSDEIKKYVNQAALNTFLGKLKDAYANNTSTKFKVNYAVTAGKVANAISFTRGNEALGTWDGSSPLTIEVGSTSPAPSVEGVLKLKGTIDAQGFHPSITSTPDEGDVYVCTANYPEGANVYKQGSEYVYVNGDFAELGPVVDVSEFVTMAEVEGAIDTALDPYITSDDAEATYAAKSDVYTKNEIDTTLEGYLQVGALSNYYDKTEIDGKLDAIDDKLEDFVTEETLEQHEADADAKYVHKVDYVTEPEVNKMFPVTYEGSTPAEFGQAIADLGVGGTLEVPAGEEVQVPTSGVYGYVLGTAANPVDVTINLAEGSSLEATDGARLFSVQPGSKLEIVGEGETTPTLTSTADEPAIFIANNASVTLEGVILSGKNYSALQSNGLNENSDFYIKNCVIEGPCYMPACGNLIIENCEFVASDNTDADAGALYVKSGSITIRNSKFYGDAAEHAGISGNWKHYNNGWYGIATALVLENCDYGGHGNLKIDIDAASQFVPGYSKTTGDENQQYDNVGILVINYNGNHAEVCNIAQNFYEIDITESAIAAHRFTTDGRGGSDQMSLRVPN